jgi:hypothetical protein
MKTIKELAAEFRQNAKVVENLMNRSIDKNQRDRYGERLLVWNAAAFELERNIPVDK